MNCSVGFVRLNTIHIGLITVRVSTLHIVIMIESVSVTEGRVAKVPKLQST